MLIDCMYIYSLWRMPFLWSALTFGAVLPSGPVGEHGGPAPSSPKPPGPAHFAEDRAGETRKVNADEAAGQAREGAETELQAPSDESRRQQGRRMNEPPFFLDRFFIRKSTNHSSEARRCIGSHFFSFFSA